VGVRTGLDDVEGRKILPLPKQLVELQLVRETDTAFCISGLPGQNCANDMMESQWRSRAKLSLTSAGAFSDMYEIVGVHRMSKF
jgi:hypothetical protein